MFASILGLPVCAWNSLLNGILVLVPELACIGRGGGRSIVGRDPIDVDNLIGPASACIDTLAEPSVERCL